MSRGHWASVLRSAIASAASVALLGCGLCGCGSGGSSSIAGASSSAAAHAHAAAGASFAAARRRLKDQDGDSTDDPKGTLLDEDDAGIDEYGKPAVAADRDAVTALVKRYYAAGAADDGATACTLIQPSLAKALPEVNDSKPDSPRPSGVSCGKAMSRLLRNVPGRPSGRLGQVQVVGVRLRGDSGMALLRLAGGEARYIPVAREDGIWRLQALFDVSLP